MLESTMTSPAKLSTDDLQTLWSQYQVTGSDQDREQLILHYLPIVKQVAWRQKRRLPSSVLLEDIESAGVIGLIEAIKAFNPQREVKFTHFCQFRIQGAIMDFLRRTDCMTRTQRNAAKHYVAACEQLSSEQGRTPTDAELRDKLKMNRTAYRNAAAAHRSMHDLSFSYLMYEEDTFTCPHSLDAGIEAVAHSELRDFVVESLPGTDQLIIILYYFEYMLMTQIGELLGLTESRVSQRLSRAMRKLRARMNGRTPTAPTPS